MITNRRTLLLGIFIILIPFFGFPSAWKTFVIIVSGALLVNSSVSITLPKKIQKRVPRRKETITPVFRESMMTEQPLVQKKEKIVSEINPGSQKETSSDQ